ncbi:MAG: pentapeptide repeat-containing protein [Oscillospiraceae bacterium]
MAESKPIKGYKVFNKDWRCREFQFTCPGTFEEDVIPKVCNRGFHFCKKLIDCFDYYKFDPENHVAEVIALGEVETNGNKSCTNKIEIVREISWHEVLDMVNIGENCTGNRNSGNWNSGDGNSGNRNSGNWNSGDWNKTNYSNGCFNTTKSKIYLFNKPSEWTYRDWLNSEARFLLNHIDYRILDWIDFEDMTDEEKTAHPEAKTTGGYLKKLDNSACAVAWWRGLSDDEKAVIKAIPNFDKEIFKEITGVDVDKEDS